LCSTEKFTVNVLFNLSPPEILSANCGSNLQEIQALGTPVATILARDQDTTVVSLNPLIGTVFMLDSFINLWS